MIVFFPYHQSFQVVPNHCWYQGHQYQCGLSLSCVFSGSKPLDLCNGGMVWSCCVPRGRAGGLDEDEFSSEAGGGFGVVSDPRKIFKMFIYHAKKVSYFVLNTYIKSFFSVSMLGTNNVLLKRSCMQKSCLAFDFHIPT